MKNIDFRKELNTSQFEAATYGEGPLLVLAGAGSGKTRVLTYRIAYLIGQKNVDPRRIMAITFTNKAAREMRERTENLLEFSSYDMWITTFHAACGRILRSNAERIGFSSNFSIYDEDATLKLVKEIIDDLGFDDKVIKPKMVRASISKFKDKMLTPSQAKAKAGFYDNDQKAARVYEIYQRRLKECNAMDYDDMLLNTIALFTSCPDVLDEYQRRFEYILVDEYQDTNKAQYFIVSLLAKKHHNLNVVGDDDQSIYAFRGADMSNILNFDREYPMAKVVKLEENYRSTEIILDAANAVIKNNTERHEKSLRTTRHGGDKIYHITACDQISEANYVNDEIKKAVASGARKYSDFAVLYRNNALSSSVETSLNKSGVPYKVYGGLRYLDRKEIRDLIAYLRLINNPEDENSLSRVVNVPKRGIGEAGMRTAHEIANQNDAPLLRVLFDAQNYPALSRAAGKMVEFATSISMAIGEAKNLSVSKLVEYVLDKFGIIREYELENTIESRARIDNLREFITVAQNFEKEQESEGNTPNLNDFMTNISLSESGENEPGEDAQNFVTLMTVHSSKGLEFPVVFLVGFESEIFPSNMTLFESENAIEEERRLCYVAFTRAKDRLYILNTDTRSLYGKTQGARRPSPFYDEIPKNLLIEKTYGTPAFERNENRNYGDRSYRKPRNDGFSFGDEPSNFGNYFNQDVDYSKPKLVGLSNAPKEKKELSGLSGECMTEFNVGDQVASKKYGTGTITKVIEGEVGDTIEVQFDDPAFGMKRLVGQYAKLYKL